MLKKRIISLLTLQDGVLFRTKKFKPDYRYTLNFVDLDLVDEVVILDVGGERENFYKTVRDFTDRCQVPTAVGGGIKTLDEVNRLFGELPVEKVVIERGLWDNPGLGGQIASKWGRQALCGGMTLRHGEKSAAVRYGDSCGEILVQDIDNDGALLGYNLGWLKAIAGIFPTIPVIAGSGCGTWAHMKEAFDVGADACATSCIHHFPPNAMKAAKQYLAEKNVPVRPV